MNIDALAVGGHEPTITDVAEVAGVSIRTVSRVINNLPRVSESTRERVQQAIHTLKFQPSLSARALARGRSFLVGIVHNDRNALVLNSVQQGVGREANRRGYEVISHSTPFAEEGAISDVLAFTRRSRVDGLIVLPPVSGIPGLPEVLGAGQILAVAVSAVPIAGYDSVVLSRESEAAGEVARHLIQLGHDLIAIINGPEAMISARERRRGFVEALEAQGVTLLAEANGDYSFASGVDAAQTLLSSDPRPTAIFAANDIMAAGVLKVAREYAIAVPEALSVVGFDGSQLAEMLSPPLTTVSRPFSQIAEIATHHLLDLVEGRSAAQIAPPKLTLITAQSTSRREV
jgi:LacI family transcriptional regulator